MVKWLALLAFLAPLPGCFEDRYVCKTDADCDVGTAARCDDGFCTAFDPACDTGHRYSEHAGELANACFAGQVTLANPCAGGQPAATREGCAATVCEALPACCDIGWSDACAQQAELRCSDLRCDTRIAVTANRNATIELWVLTWNGSTWRADPRTDRKSILTWVGPAPGTPEPRLAGIDALDDSRLFVGDVALPAVSGRSYLAITSVDFDRSGRDTLAVAYDASGQHLQLFDVDSRTLTRDIFTDVGLRLAWGDSDRDGFPDGIAGRGAQYTLVHNIDGELHLRTVEATQSAAFGGGPTPNGNANSPQLRNLDWIDLTGDGRLDLVAFGNQIRVHADEGALRDMPLLALDCDAPRTGCNMPESTQTSYAGAVVPAIDQPSLVVAMFTDPTLNLPRKLFRVTVSAGPPATFTATPIADACPTCPEIVALAARDLDGDHVLDIIGLDADLKIYTLLSSGSPMLQTDPFAGSGNGPFTNVVITTTGAPIP